MDQSGKKRAAQQKERARKGAGEEPPTSGASQRERMNKVRQQRSPNQPFISLVPQKRPKGHSAHSGLPFLQKVLPVRTISA